MSAYLITGPNGTGKSTTGKILKARGYVVIDSDFAAGLASWVEDGTDTRITDLPPYPYPEAWLNTHRWLWDRAVLEKLTREQPSDKPVFVVGGAYNQTDMFDLFTKWFSLYIDRDTAIRRLQSRGEGSRWDFGSAELERTLAWHEKSKMVSEALGGIVVDSRKTPDEVTDEILAQSVGATAR